MNIGERFKEERNRLVLTQSQTGDLLGKGKTTIINWEKDVGAPDAVQLSELLQHGFDVNYIITGKKAANTPYATGGLNSNNAVRQEYLSDRERVLLDNYRASTDEGKLALDAVCAVVAQPQLKRGIKM